MANVTFYLNYDKRDKNQYVPIYLRFSDKGKDFRHFTGEKILSPVTQKDKYWNSERHRVITKHTNSRDINDHLDRLSETTNRLYRDERLKDRTPSVLKVKSLLIASIETPGSKIDFFPAFDEYIKVNSTSKAVGTVKNYRNSLHYVKIFVEEKRYPLEFGSVDLTFNEKFNNFLLDTDRLTNNTIGRIYKNLKSFLNWAVEKGYTENLAFKKFKAKKQNKEVVYLTYDELFALYNYKIEDEYLQKIRDIFCLGCFTGLRISDLQKVTKDSIAGDHIKVQIVKTKEIIQVPLLPESKAILKKYNFSIPKFEPQEINKHIKGICFDAGIDESMTDIKYKGAERIERTCMKCDLITTHIARKTFVTLSLELGMPAQDVMGITGHSDYRSMRPYIKVADKTKQKSLLNAWGNKNNNII